MNCPKCGSPIQPGTKFCGTCGERIDIEPQVQQPIPEQPVYSQPAEPQQPVYSQPAEPQPAYSQPPVYQQPAYTPPAAPVYDQPAAPQQPAESSITGLGIGGFVLALLSMFLFWVPFLGLILAVVGLILSCLGLSRSRAKGRTDGLAVAGLVIAAIFAIVGLIYTISLISALSCAASYGGYNSLRDLERMFDF